MLVNSIFSFSHNVFYPTQNKFQYLDDISLGEYNTILSTDTMYRFLE